MAPRPIWKGSISFGLVTIPIGLVSAIEPREELSFHMLHRKDGSRIVQKRFCKSEDVEVPWKDVVKGYEYARGKYVVVTDEDFERARVPATRMVEIRAFVDAGDVHDLYFDHPYFVAPEGRAGVKAYALLRDALADSGKLGVGAIVLRQREHPAALAPYGEALVLTTMRFAHEIRSLRDLDLPAVGKSWTAKEMKLARQLIEALGDTWKPKEFRDTYTERLRRVVEARLAGKEIVAPEQVPRRPRVVNLADALRQSLEARSRTPATASGRGSAARKKAPVRTRRQAA
jgi:DNA end-binding protein Ku